MPTTPEQARQRGRAARAGSKTKSEALKKKIPTARIHGSFQITRNSIMHLSKALRTKTVRSTSGPDKLRSYKAKNVVLKKIARRMAKFRFFFRLCL